MEEARISESDHWRMLRISALEHPNVVSGNSEIGGAVSREWIQAIADEYGEGSATYKSRVLAEFPTENVEGLLRREWLLEAFDKHESGHFDPDAEWKPPVFALDVARYGPDASCLAVVQGSVVRSLELWRGLNTVETAQRVIDRGTALGNARRRPMQSMTWVDAVGLGAGVVDTLSAKGWPVRSYNGGASPQGFDAKRRFLNLRSQSFWVLRDLLERGEIALPRSPELEEECLATQWTTTPSGAIQIIGKDLVRKELGRSPDRLDAVVFGTAITSGRVGPGPPRVFTYQLTYGGIEIHG